MKKSAIKATFTSDIEKVWDVVTDSCNYGWRGYLSKITVAEDGQSFVEYTQNDFSTEFTITCKKPYERYEFDMENKNMKGHWVGVFSKIDTGTQIEFIEEVQAHNPIVRLFTGSYLKKQQASYVSDLRKALGE